MAYRPTAEPKDPVSNRPNGSRLSLPQFDRVIMQPAFTECKCIVADNGRPTWN